MRIRFLIVPVILVAGLVAMVGCSKKTTPEQTDKSALTWEMRTVERSLDSLAGGTRIIIRYPEIVEAESESTLDSINADIIHTVLERPADSVASATPDEMAERFIKNYRNYHNDFPDDTIPWTEDRKMAVATDTNGVLGLAFSITSYTGGAHPSSVTDYANYDQVSGRRYRIGDLFIEGYRETLNKAAEPYFRASRDILPTADLSAAGFTFPDGHFAVNDNFLITTDGLTFTFNPYEVAPYSLGATTFTVPYSALMDIIDPSGPLARFVAS